MLCDEGFNDLLNYLKVLSIDSLLKHYIGKPITNQDPMNLAIYE